MRCSCESHSKVTQERINWEPVGAGDGQECGQRAGLDLVASSPCLYLHTQEGPALRSYFAIGGLIYFILSKSSVMSQWHTHVNRNASDQVHTHCPQLAMHTEHF